MQALAYQIEGDLGAFDGQCRRSVLAVSIYATYATR